MQLDFMKYVYIYIYKWMRSFTTQDKNPAMQKTYLKQLGQIFRKNRNDTNLQNASTTGDDTFQHNPSPSVGDPLQ